MNINDASIKSQGEILGMSMGLKLDYGISSKIYVSVGTSLFINQGGTLHYRDGGNFLPLSELKLPQFNKGPRPLSDNSSIEYHAQFWSSSIGFKTLLNETAKSKVYLECPSMHFNRLVKARGTITNNKKILTEEEDIIRDLRPWTLAVSVGLGIEKRISRNALIYSSLQYIHSLSDLTLNNGFKSILIEKGIDPANNIYQTSPDNSKAIINGFALNLGLYF
jgi:hypothetical protein